MKSFFFEIQPQETPSFIHRIPVYNVEPYVEKCLRSVAKQTFTDFEVIVIEDGSTDASGKICDDFAATDSRFRVIPSCGQPPTTSSPACALSRANHLMVEKLMYKS